MVDTAPKSPPPSGCHLVQQDIQLTRECQHGVTRVVARVECARRGRAVDAEQCARCPHFVRIETHEAGYLMLCRAHEEDAAEGAGSEEQSEEQSPA